MLLSTGPPFCLHILHCHSKGLSRNWADFWNLKCEYLPNYWSDLSEINCDGFSFKSPLIWYTSFSQRHKAIFGCCIATSTSDWLHLKKKTFYSIYYADLNQKNTANCDLMRTLLVENNNVILNVNNESPNDNRKWILNSWGQTQNHRKSKNMVICKLTYY